MTMTTVDLDALEAGTRECVERALKGYIECALWSSTGEDDVPLDQDHDADDLAPEAHDQMLDDVYSFLWSCWDADLDLGPIEPEQIGHDLWLTRNHHGAGFWDRGLGDLGDRLTDLCRPMGDADLYVGDDGLIHHQ